MILVTVPTSGVQAVVNYGKPAVELGQFVAVALPCTQITVYESTSSPLFGDSSLHGTVRQHPVMDLEFLTALGCNLVSKDSAILHRSCAGSKVEASSMHMKGGLQNKSAPSLFMSKEARPLLCNFSVSSALLQAKK